MSGEAETDLGERTCIVTRRAMEPDALLRFVRGPDGAAVPDLKRKLPGRGVWVGLSRQTVAQAVAKDAFSRAFGAKTAAATNLPDVVGQLLRKQALATISLAKKAGLAIAGFDKVEEVMRRKEAAILIHASEAADDGKRRLDRLAGVGVEIVTFYTVDELDLAFGRSNVIHAAVKKGALASQLVLAVQRNRMYEAGGTPPSLE